MRKLMEDQSEALTGIQTHGEDSGLLKCSPSKFFEQIQYILIHMSKAIL